MALRYFSPRFLSSIVGTKEAAMPDNGNRGFGNQGPGKYDHYHGTSGCNDQHVGDPYGKNPYPLDRSSYKAETIKVYSREEYALLQIAQSYREGVDKAEFKGRFFEGVIHFAEGVLKMMHGDRFG